MLEDMDRACNRIKRALPRCRIFYDQPPPADEPVEEEMETRWVPDPEERQREVTGQRVVARTSFSSVDT